MYPFLTDITEPLVKILWSTLNGSAMTDQIITLFPFISFTLVLSFLEFLSTFLSPGALVLANYLLLQHSAFCSTSFGLLTFMEGVCAVAPHLVSIPNLLPQPSQV